MTSAIVTIEGLGKRYRLRHLQDGAGPGYDTLRDTLAATAAAPWRWLRRGARPVAPSREDFWALKDVSLEIAPGEVVGIIGRNGAGKSTLLKILSRITEPTEGRVTLQGRVASLLEVGTGFHPELTGRENIFLNGAILGMSRAEITRKFDEIVRFAEVERFLDTPVKHYSSGMYVRLAFAVAAHLEPEILVVDEVLAVGDAEFQKKCLGKMHDVSQGGRTVLFVSHNLAAVEALCDRAVLLRAGRLDADGPVAGIIARYHAQTSSRTSSTHAFDRSRRATRAPIFTSASLVDAEGRDTSQIPLGGELVLEIGLRSARRLRAPSLGIGIDDVMGQRLLTLHNPIQGSVLDDIEGSGSVRCRVRSFPLAPGEYVVKLALSDRTEEIDVVENAFTFEVVNADGLKDGRGHLRGLCVAPSEWTYSAGSSKGPLL